MMCPCLVLQKSLQISRAVQLRYLPGSTSSPHLHCTKRHTHSSSMATSSSIFKEAVPSHAAVASSSHTDTSSKTLAAQSQSSSSTIQRQLELYNSHDLDAFMDLMADDVVAVDGITGVVIGTGVAALRLRYEARFAARSVHCELLGRLVLGKVVVDREVISGLPDGGVADCLATYLVQDSKIKRMTFVWQPRSPGTTM